MKPSILFILHLPDPVHGASMVGKYIKESEVINREFAADFINLSTSNILSEVNKIGLAKVFRILKIQLQVLKALSTKKYDLCYMTLSANGFGFYKDLLIVALLKLYNKNIIYHFHNKGVSDSSSSSVDNFLYKFTFNKTKSILLSKLLYVDIQKYVKENDVYFCPNGVAELKEINPSPKPLSNSPSCKLLFLSNMMADKGVFVLMEALKILDKKNISFECHFIGSWFDVTESNFKDEIIKRNLQGKVFAHGSKFGEDKQSFFKDSDIFVFPTHYKKETFGLVNLEAMQYSLPIISTCVGGIPDVVIDGQTGFLIPEMDFSVLADKLELLINNPAMRIKMGIAGKERFHKYFTLNAFENNLVNILKSAANVF